MIGEEKLVWGSCHPLRQPPFLSSFGRERMGVGGRLDLDSLPVPHPLFRSSEWGMGRFGVLEK